MVATAPTFVEEPDQLTATTAAAAEGGMSSHAKEGHDISITDPAVDEPDNATATDKEVPSAVAPAVGRHAIGNGENQYAYNQGNGST